MELPTAEETPAEEEAPEEKEETPVEVTPTEDAVVEKETPAEVATTEDAVVEKVAPVEVAPTEDAVVEKVAPAEVAPAEADADILIENPDAGIATMDGAEKEVSGTQPLLTATAMAPWTML